jgi:aconitate hydratase
LKLTGKEVFDIVGIERGAAKTVAVVAHGEGGKTTKFEARLRIDTPKELEYYRHGGILHYVLRQLAAARRAA